MESFQARHFVLVRHGESYGDVRRKLVTQALIHPLHEKQTEAGHRQSQITGRWITKHIMQVYGFNQFDTYLTSKLIRTKESAESLGLSSDWIKEPRLIERDRGYIQGLTKQQHRDLYPDSYQSMLDHPFCWVPPGGESILAVSHRFGELVNDLATTNKVLIMSHRDVLWAAHVPLDKLALDKIEDVDTDSIQNGQVIHYTNINPTSGVVEGVELAWKRSVNPSSKALTTQNNDWSRIPVN